MDFDAVQKINFDILDGLWILFRTKYIYLELLLDIAWESRRGSWARMARMRLFEALQKKIENRLERIKSWPIFRKALERAAFVPF